jgi:hypothetical protein
VQRLSEEYGSATVLRALRYLCLRLQRFEDASSIANELDARRQELAHAQEAYDHAYTARLAATAEVSYRDDLLDEAVLNVAEEALRFLPGGKEDARYQALFPIEPADAVASTASQRQHRFVHALVQTLRDDRTLGPLQPHATLIEQRQQALEETLAERELHFQREMEATRQKNEALDEACRAYNRSFSRLQLLFRDGARIASLYPNLAPARAVDPEG